MPLVPLLPPATQIRSTQGPKGVTPPQLRNRDIIHKTGSTTLSHVLSTVSAPNPPQRDYGTPSTIDQQAKQVAFPNPLQPEPTQEMTSRTLTVPTRQLTSTLDQNPLIAEILRQITVSKTSVHELRAQLVECQHAALQSRDSLQSELEVYRDRKRQEDITKADTKTRLKALSDVRRNVASAQREVDKRLKASESAQHFHQQRLDQLDNEIAEYHDRLQADKSVVQQNKQHFGVLERKVGENIENTRRDIKMTEDVLAALGTRARELEERLSTERQRLQSVRQELEAQRLNRQPEARETETISCVITTESELRIPPIPRSIDTQFFGSGKTHHELQGVSPGVPYPGFQDRKATPPSDTKLQHGLYSVLESYPAVNSLALSESLYEPPVNVHGRLDHLQNGKSSQEWQDATSRHPQTLTEESPPLFSFTTSPVPANHPGVDYYQDLSEFGAFSHVESDPLPWRQRSALEHNGLLAGDASLLLLSDQADTRNWTASGPHPEPRTVSGNPIRGLNPDAKAFNFRKKHSPCLIHPLPFDISQANGLGSQSLVASTASSLLRAFAPSPAEREALQRALGGSANASLERLPSLSDVGNIPTPSANLPAKLLVRSLNPGRREKRLTSWFQSLSNPLQRKSTFCPWDDEDGRGSGELVTTDGAGSVSIAVAEPL